MKKIIAILLIVILFALTSCSNGVELINSYETRNNNDVTITYDDDADTYDVFIESENRHIVVPRRYTEVVASNHSNAVIEEYNTGETKIIFYFTNIYWNMN